MQCTCVLPLGSFILSFIHFSLLPSLFGQPLHQSGLASHVRHTCMYTHTHTSSHTSLWSGVFGDEGRKDHHCVGSVWANRTAHQREQKKWFKFHLTCRGISGDLPGSPTGFRARIGKEGKEMRAGSQVEINRIQGQWRRTLKRIDVWGQTLFYYRITEEYHREIEQDWEEIRGR